jgi:hypothetical protein
VPWLDETGWNNVVGDPLDLRIELTAAVATPLSDSAPIELHKPLQRSLAQDAAILQAIESLGHNRLEIPRNPSGKRGVKAEVRDKVRREHKYLFVGTTVFDKAWERLSANGSLVIKK